MGGIEGRTRSEWPPGLGFPTGMAAFRTEPIWYTHSTQRANRGAPWLSFRLLSLMDWLLRMTLGTESLRCGASPVERGRWDYVTSATRPAARLPTRSLETSGEEPMAFRVAPSPAKNACRTSLAHCFRFLQTKPTFTKGWWIRNGLDDIDSSCYGSRLLAVEELFKKF